ncbi:hypothetical protein PVAG01_02169 [Phlyctema vagabunda]|uniref:Zn(2)-C6 fungal-type domain-containing protein n=1 Tax=Phlyctema vagabunda TaxID=108571 RepID=A0ABR4PQB3_9HELO
MPKLPDRNSCVTCRRRKVKCDGQKPKCANCGKSGRFCERPKENLKFVIHSADATHAEKDANMQSHLLHNLLLRANEELNRDALERVYELASGPPRQALRVPDIARLFTHYINVLAPWYDLNDMAQSFGRVIPVMALDNIILFKALIAVSAIHLNKTTGLAVGYAPAFHAACVRELLLSMEERVLEPEGGSLAATCLLRTFEIMNCDSRQDQRHLLGAYSFVVNDYTDMATRGLFQAGAWNYLREEITVALECRRKVRISNSFNFQWRDDLDDDMQANAIALTLAKVINFAFDNEASSPSASSPESIPEHVDENDRITTWAHLINEVREWKKNLPASFEPYSTAPKPGNMFPSLWMAKSHHIAAQQYWSCCEVLLSLANPLPGAEPDLGCAESHALRVCGLACSNENMAATVNSFGMLAFCGRFLTQPYHRRALEDALTSFNMTTAWPVTSIMQDLKEHWTYK